MTRLIPKNPKIYHIVHIDRLPSILKDDRLWCDAEIINRNATGTSIGMDKIKQRRLNKNKLSSYPDLYVGDCVPFYFCTRSVMLYLIYCGNHLELDYKDGQEPILHLEADLNATVAWAKQQGKRWAFTLSNAGSFYFQDRCNLAQLHEIDWRAINARDWRDCADHKQAEFLVEYEFPWHLMERIGVRNMQTCQHVAKLLQDSEHKPKLDIKPEWYY